MGLQRIDKTHAESPNGLLQDSDSVEDTSVLEVAPLKGSSTKNFLSPKSHILDSNGVWYSSFWSEGPKIHRNLKILVSKFVPRGFEARRT